MRKKQKTNFDLMSTERFEMRIAYWELTSIDLLDSSQDMDGEKIAAWILKCEHDRGLSIALLSTHAGGFLGNLGHDPHILYILWTMQSLAFFVRLHAVDADKIATFNLVTLLCWDSGFHGSLSIKIC